MLLVCTSCRPDLSPAPAQTAVAPEYRNQSWWPGENSCSAPCWQGLTLEKSTKAETLEVLKKQTYLQVDENRFEEDVQNKSSADLSCLQPDGQICVTVFFKSNSLVDLKLLPNYPLTFKDVVEKMGPPDGFRTDKKAADAPGCDVYLVWKKKRMAIAFYETWHPYPFYKDYCDIVREAGNKIPPSLPVVEIRYLNEEALRDFTSFAYRTWRGFIDCPIKSGKSL